MVWTEDPITTKARVFRTVKFAVSLISLYCLFAGILPNTAHAQSEAYPPLQVGSSQGNLLGGNRLIPGYSLFEPKYTFSLFLGARLGGKIAINTPNVDYLPISSSLNYGFNVGARIVPNVFGEFMWNRQTTTLSAHDIPSNTIVPLTNNAHLDMYQASLLYEIWVRSRLRPFVVGGIGFTHFDSHGILSFSNRFSYNLGGGVKYLFAPQMALRGELRWSPSQTTNSSTTFCDPFLGCYVTPITNHAQQWQANIGIEFRF